MFGARLLKILDGSFKHTDVVVAGDIGIAACAESLAVAHLTEDSAVRRGNTLNSKH